MKISLIIPCRNERRHIREFLNSLQQQELDPGWELEILVADGMSDDGTREVLRESAAACPGIRLIDNPGQIVSTGLNEAIREAEGEIVIRLDAHTVYAPDYVRECVYALRESGAENVGGPWVAQGRGTVGKAIAAAFQSPFCTGGGKAHDPHYSGEVDTVYLGCWPRSTFQRTGGFDPELVRNQDDEFNFRLRRMGGRIWQSARIRSIYTPRDSVSALFRQYMQYGFWKVAVIRKHRALAAWRHAVPPLFVGSIAVGALLSLAAVSLQWTDAALWIAAAVTAELSLYALACCAAALRFARTLAWRSLLMLPAVMGVYHVAYGCGFLAGLVKHGFPESGGGKAHWPAFRELTR